MGSFHQFFVTSNQYFAWLWHDMGAGYLNWIHDLDIHICYVMKSDIILDSGKSPMARNNFVATFPPSGSE